ncbi:hypothetical protein CK820_G0022467 [Pan troglodytes]|uniref:Uncharacterized protein n=1 Tax=Pan troglodytes TaxID=9598 RepID=A0A2J8M900_PANTR|nr:hypothetical protein CK820_G0022467 [Pan troglodytes]
MAPTWRCRAVALGMTSTHQRGTFFQPASQVTQKHRRESGEMKKPALRVFKYMEWLLVSSRSSSMAEKENMLPWKPG